MTTLQKMDQLLKRGWINFRIEKRGEQWFAVTDRGEVLSAFCARDSKTELKDWLASRYLAEVHKDSAYVNCRWALKNPRFAGPYGGLRELATSLVPDPRNPRSH